jgi:hypothetical protein
MKMKQLRSEWSCFTIHGMGLLSLCVAMGCDQSSSKPTAHLSGNVTINGEPIPEDAKSTIIFRPLAKGMAKTAGVPIKGGRYDSPETPVGEVIVLFSIQQPTGKMISDAGGPLFPELQNIVPEGSTDGVKLTVTGDNPEQSFNLE